jgi:recyclin-1
MDSVIIKNLKRQQVSPQGALQLVWGDTGFFFDILITTNSDMNRYHTWSTTLRVASVPRLFQVLKALGPLYMSEGGNELRGLVHDNERYQGALRPEEIYELLACRTDYRKIKGFVESKECLVM